MKKIILIGTALSLLVVPFLSACGVPQEDLDTAIAERDAAQAQVASLQSDLATAESDLAAAESDLAAAQSALATAQSAKAAAESAKATAQSSLATAQSQLAAAQAEIADLEGQIALLEEQLAAAEEVVEEEEEVVEEEEEVVEEEEEVTEEVEVTTSFEAATYTNADLGLTVKYPATYTDKSAEISEESAAKGQTFYAGTGPYSLPRVVVYIVDTANAATWDDLLLYITGDQDLDIASSAESTLANGRSSYEALVYFIGLGYPIDGWFVGAQKGGKWVVYTVWTITMYFPIDEALAWEIVRTMTL